MPLPSLRPIPWELRLTKQPLDRAGTWGQPKAAKQAWRWAEHMSSVPPETPLWLFSSQAVVMRSHQMKSLDSTPCCPRHSSRDVDSLTTSVRAWVLSRQGASTADSPNKDCPCCLGQRWQQAKPEATAHQRDQMISSWGWASSLNYTTYLKLFTIY